MEFDYFDERKMYTTEADLLPEFNQNLTPNQFGFSEKFDLDQISPKMGSSIQVDQGGNFGQLLTFKASDSKSSSIDKLGYGGGMVVGFLHKGSESQQGYG